MVLSSIARSLLHRALQPDLLFPHDRKDPGYGSFDLSNTPGISKLADGMLETEIEKFFLELLMLVIQFV